MTQALRDQAVALYREGLTRITPEFLMRQALRADGAGLRLAFQDRTETVALAADAGVHVLAVGKAAAPMAAEARRLLGGRTRRGLIVTKAGFALPDAPFAQRETGHPVPDEAGVAAAGEAEALAQGVPAGDVLLVLVSGGASALLPAPVEGVTLADKQALVQLMLRADMDIHEINRVRKGISRLKGGGLAALAGRASGAGDGVGSGAGDGAGSGGPGGPGGPEAAPRVVGLYLSDVPGDALSSIGSGPTVPEAVDYPGLVRLLRGKGLWDRTPAAVRRVLEAGRAPPKQPARPPVNGLIGANRHLLRAIEASAQAAGFRTRVIERPVTGLNRDALPVLLGHWAAWRREAGAGALALVCGGETTVEVRGQGRGGRCQELAALALAAVDGETVFLAAGSDGNDGPTDAAGGVVDRESWLRAQAAGVPYAALLADNDSYRLLERTGNLIRVPPTRNNVMDVYVLLRAGG
jgi:glycerate-2-kinase